jgi:hypothetical protein
MPGRSQSIIEHQLPIKDGYNFLNRPQEDLNPSCLKILKRNHKAIRSQFHSAMLVCRVDFKNSPHAQEEWQIEGLH